MNRRYQRIEDDEIRMEISQMLFIASNEIDQNPEDEKDILEALSHSCGEEAQFELEKDVMMDWFEAHHKFTMFRESNGEIIYDEFGFSKAEYGP